AGAVDRAAEQRNVAGAAVDRDAVHVHADRTDARGGADDREHALDVHAAGAVGTADQDDAEGRAVAGDVDVAPRAVDADGVVGVTDGNRDAAALLAVADQGDRAAGAGNPAVHRDAVADDAAAVHRDVAALGVEIAVQAHAGEFAGALLQDVAAAGGDPAVDRHAVAFGAGPVAAHHDSAVLAVEAAVQAHAGVAAGAVQQDPAAGGGDRATAGDPHANAARHAAGQRHVAVVAQDRQAGDRDAVCGIPRGGADD